LLRHADVLVKLLILIFIWACIRHFSWRWSNCCQFL